MLCVPAASVLVVHAAVRTLPEPVSAAAEQPAIDVALSLKLTDPVGLVPVVAGVMSTISVSSDPEDHSKGLATRICAPLLGQEKLAAGLLGLSKPIGCRNSSQ